MTVRPVDSGPTWRWQVAIFPGQSPAGSVDVVQAPYPHVWGVGLDVAFRQRLLQRANTHTTLEVIGAIRAVRPTAGVLKKIGLLWQNHVHGDARS